MIAVAIAWVVLWRVSALMEYAPHASIWFPPASLTLAAFIVMGWRAAFALVPAAVLVTFWTNAIYQIEQSAAQTLHTGVLFALTHAGSYGLGAAILRWLGGRNPGPSLPAFVIAFLVVASVSALLAAVLGVQALIAGGALEASESGGLWLPWWVGDMAAAVALTPLIAGLLGAGRGTGQRWFPVIDLPVARTRVSSWLFKLTVLLVPLAAIMALTALFAQDELLAFAVFFLILPQMWITYTESAFRVAVSLTAFSVMIALSVSLLGLEAQAMVYQFAITIIAASTWFGLSVPTLVEQNRRLRKLAEADELTGVSSRRHFFDCAREQLAIQRGRRMPAALVIFDIDHFKEINDSYGHSVGDEALRRVAGSVGAHLRRQDLFGRFGGDEFLVLMRNCTHRRAFERAEELRQAVRSIRLPGLDIRLSGTFSVVEVEPEEDIASAFDRGDALLLAAKRSGRDQVAADDSH